MLGEALLGIATNLATDAIKVTYRKAHVAAWGDAEWAAVRSALTAALTGLAAEMAAHQCPGRDLDPALVELLEEQLHRIVTDPEIADLLVQVALDGADLPIDRLRKRIEELGFDESTMLADVEATMTRFQISLATELTDAASADSSALFNRVVIAKLTALLERQGRLERAVAAPVDPDPYGQGEPVPHGAPQPEALFVGRDEEMRDLRVRLSARGAGAPVQILTAVHGWPGVGKTTLAARLANDRVLLDGFPDGVLWASVGDTDRTTTELASWARQLRLPAHLIRAPRADLEDELRRVLRDRRMLLVVDDVWDVAQARPFLVGGPQCATLVTTRLPQVANGLARSPADLFPLKVLSEAAARSLLALLAPGVVADHPAECDELVAALEYLPLAIQVAGRLLHEESSADWGVGELLAELRDGEGLLDADAPADTAAIDDTVPTVSALLRRSTERLAEEDRLRFAYLGAFAPKPATFELEDISAVWDTPHPKDGVRRLVRLGLLEPIGRGRFQMHALLVLHAQTLLTEAQ